MRDDGATLEVDNRRVEVAITKSSRFWWQFQPAARSRIPVGEGVVVRVKTAGGKTELKELADPGTASWLEAIRRTTLPGRVSSVSPTSVTVEFAERRAFTFRASEKSSISLGGKKLSLLEVPVGTTVYTKGRLLPSYDTWLVSLSDTPPAAPAPAKSTGGKTSTGSKGRPSAPANSPPPVSSGQGKAKGIVALMLPAHNMFDLKIDGRFYHISLTPTTQFTVAGRKADASALELDMEVEVTYRRDRFGRIVALKVAIP